MTKWLLLVCLVLAMPAGAGAADQASGAERARQAVQAAEGFFAQLLAARADMYWHAGDYPSCVRILSLQTDLDPSDIESYDDAAYLLWSMERLGEAEAVYAKGIASNPTNYRLYFELGYMYYRTARPGSIYKKQGEESKRLYEKAATQLRKAVKYPHPPDVGRLLAHTLGHLGRTAEAREAWEGVLEINPTDAIAKRELERMDKASKQGGGER